MLEQFMKVLNFHAITAITKATQAGSLEKHINTAHEGVSYSCNQCDSKFSQKRILYKQMK